MLLSFLGTISEETKECISTYYYAVSGAITASGKKVNPEKVKTNEHRWIAISRDLRKIYNYGDTVIIESKECPILNGEWVINDLMHKKWKNKIDFLVHPEKIKTIGFNKPHNIKIIKKKGHQDLISR